MSTDESTHKYVPCPDCGSIQIRVIVAAEVDVTRPNLSDLRLFCLDCHAVFGLEVASMEYAPISLKHKFGMDASS